MRATTGFGNRSGAATFQASCESSSGVASRKAATSPPAVKFSPAPVITTKRTPSSSASSEKRRASCPRASSGTRFIFAGSSSVIVASPRAPSWSTRNPLYAVTSTPDDFGGQSPGPGRKRPNRGLEQTAVGTGSRPFRTPKSPLRAVSLGLSPGIGPSRRVSLAQHSAQDLPRRALRELGHEAVLARALEAGKRVGGEAVGVELVRRHRVAGDDDRDHPVAEPLVGRAHDRDLVHARVPR